ncbi:hypothetical protein EVAR_659_1 [Eumeta japonica]|uniref:Uncharacterized protein n=1 Tax=Eumeta variegata TaxID=151549 RepID=A0A4C1SBC3_EUMVA|nr:hypothetical protein EVAR_659_1 [Eumeta japonica]
MHAYSNRTELQGMRHRLIRNNFTARVHGTRPTFSAISDAVAVITKSRVPAAAATPAPCARGRDCIAISPGRESISETGHVAFLARRDNSFVQFRVAVTESVNEVRSRMAKCCLRRCDRRQNTDLQLRSRDEKILYMNIRRRLQINKIETNEKH